MQSGIYSSMKKIFSEFILEKKKVKQIYNMIYNFYA